MNKEIAYDQNAAAVVSPVPGPVGTGSVTPMMAQYMEIKAINPDCLLFYRMGDFFELFFEDAVQASKVLGITLTKRGKHRGEDIPMCGVPVRAVNEYLHKLIEMDFRVAVCDQLEDPVQAKKRGAKAIVRRGVTRLVTRGTLTEDNLLDAKANNYLLAVARSRHSGDDAFGLAWLDISTGEFFTSVSAPGRLVSDITRLQPGEILIAENLLAEDDFKDLKAMLKSAITPLAAQKFDSDSGRRRLENLFGVAVIDGLGAFSRAELGACGGLVDYVELTQAGQLPVIKRPQRIGESAVLIIDAATRRNLELVRTLDGSRKGSLVSVIDRTVTGAGARVLVGRLSSPLAEPDKINARFDGVDYFVSQRRKREAVRAALKICPDIARALSRLSLNRGGPRDLGAVRDALRQAFALSDILPGAEDGEGAPDSISDLKEVIDRQIHEVFDKLDNMLAVELPMLARDGGFIRVGVRAELDEQRKLHHDNRQVIAGLQADYAELAGVKSLKIKHNNVLGFFVDVTVVHGEKLMAAPLNETFIHRQTLASAVRFSTVELGEKESQIAAAAARALAIELDLFEDMRRVVLDQAEALGVLAQALADLDVTAALALLAETENYIRPKVDDSQMFVIQGGRHPVVEWALARDNATPFVGNACDLSADGSANGGDAHPIWLLTGPNMAGKSTFLRQNALITILAQMGSFVPAEAAHIGVVDKIFSRVGAADDLARGRSTFMVEMVESAAILHQATERSLVILDEIGRGTATFDGLSIAWAVVEHLHEVNKCRGLFATHYHELTALAGKLPGLMNASMRVKEFRGEVVFLHEVTAGAADRSYGIQVARLAGLPAGVIERARQVLAALEERRSSGAGSIMIDDLPLFSVEMAALSGRQTGPSVVEERLAEIAADDLSPRAALELIYELKKLVKRRQSG